VIIVVAVLLLATPALAQHTGAQPFSSKDTNCPSGYYRSGGFCTPLNKDSRPALPRPPGASCPSGWYALGLRETQ
jgi:hypothetical protein